ncbi:YphA family membrane protein [Halalkalibacter akibai]|uniref:Uncharacterized protein n=1 Tax=Halalkalibacter akibai (strain ATCC 43226 / DSM 21942 / CIP 109018 / JCM 9157 / 1139) TaxID=1236973 RepID=W4QR33_HALA3|nr:hypothetical protein [Halalkalibacter akibai]GAE34536.1 hypothetical protein JCM9157_1604 [Halalkalibacter akibai JCM 9157]
MDGIYVYWFGWLFWVVVSFFWPKTKKRLGIAALLLVLLIMLPFDISIGHVSIHFAFICFSIYLFSYLKSNKKRQLFLYFIVTITIAAAYGGFQLLLVFDPVIEYVDSRWMSASFVALIAFLLAHVLKDRIIVTLIGLVQGELLTGLTFQQYLYMDRAIGSLYFFDVISIVGIIFTTFWVIQRVSSWIANLVVPDQKHGALKKSS